MPKTVKAKTGKVNTGKVLSQPAGQNVNSFPVRVVESNFLVELA